MEEIRNCRRARQHDHPTIHGVATELIPELNDQLIRRIWISNSHKMAVDGSSFRKNDRPASMPGFNRSGADSGLLLIRSTEQELEIVQAQDHNVYC